MKIASWNINSIRMRVERLVAWLAAAQPDVLCLQELKCTDEQFPHEAIKAAGYYAAVFGQKTYNGVAILAKKALEDEVRGIDDGVADTHSRLIGATVEGVRVYSLYAPNGQAVGSEAYEYKLEFYARLRRYLDRCHKPTDKLVVTGDFNVAPEPIDVHDPAEWEGQTLFSEKERQALKQLMDFGLVDTFRAKNPGLQKFSWWDYRQLSFPKNKGLRIDHVLATRPLAEKCTASEIDREARKGKQPSDHAPVWATFEI